jgi:hypothetical protein
VRPAGDHGVPECLGAAKIVALKRDDALDSEPVRGCLVVAFPRRDTDLGTRASIGRPGDTNQRVDVTSAWTMSSLGPIWSAKTRPRRIVARSISAKYAAAQSVRIQPVHPAQPIPTLAMAWSKMVRIQRRNEDQRNP